MLLVGAMVFTAVGTLDALVSREWDFLVIFGVVTVFLAAFWIRQRAHRVSVALRPDLAHWIEARAERSGEPFEDVLDRAVAAYKDGIVTDDASR